MGAGRADAIASALVVPRAANAEVTIAVPTIRDAVRLRHCLQSAVRVAADDGIPVQIVVVLDGAEPDVEAFAANIKGAVVVSWPERRGLAAALNAALRATAARYVAVLQDDAVPQRKWLSSLVATAARYPQAGALGTLVRWPDGTIQSAGAAWEWVVGPARGDHPPAASTLHDASAVDYVASSSLLVNRAAWADVGGFDEDLYPAMNVDADFCAALWHAGWMVLLEPGSVVVHERHGSTSRPYRSFVYRRNRLRFLEKWGGFVDELRASRGQLEAAMRAAKLVEARPSPEERRSVREPADDPPIVHLRRERDVLRAYVIELEARLAHLEATQPP